MSSKLTNKKSNVFPRFDNDQVEDNNFFRLDSFCADPDKFLEMIDKANDPDLMLIGLQRRNRTEKIPPDELPLDDQGEEIKSYNACVALVSRYREDLDGKLEYIEVTKAQMNSSARFFIDLVAFAGVPVVISHRGRRQYIIEPGADMITVLAFKSRLSRRKFARALERGALAHVLEAA